MARVERIGRYEIVAPLAQGGMGEVLLARVRGLGGFTRHVVLKTIDLASDDREKATAMFLDEARVLGRLHHQHIAPVFEINEDDGKLYLVIDYVHGRTAQEIWQKALDTGTQLPYDFALAIVGGAASGLHYAHTRVGDDGKPLHIVHRDVSLTNLMIGYDGAIKLIDFGIAKVADRRIKTDTGFVKGKLGYLSPEQLRAQEVDPRTDVFALGIVLYELTTMTRPFREQSDRMTAERIKSGAYRKPSELVANFPPELEAIIVRALRVDPRERFESADAMRRAIDALGHHYELVVGDAAIVEVMGQLFEEQREPWQGTPRAPTDLEIASAPPRKKPLRSATEIVESLASELDQPSRSPRLDSAIDTRPNDVPTGEFDDAAPTAIAGSALAEAVRAEAQLARPTTIPVDEEAITADGPAHPLEPADRVASIQRLFTSIDPSETPMHPIDAISSPPPEPAPRQSTKRGIVGGNTDQNEMLPPEPVPAAPLPVRSSGSRRRIAWIALALIIAGGIAITLYTIVPTGDEAMPVVSAPAADRGSATGSVASGSGSAGNGSVASISAAGSGGGSATAGSASGSAAQPGSAAMTLRTIAIKITSKPSGATVVLDGKRLGKTPYDASAEVTPGTHVIKVRMVGFNTIKVEVSADDTTVEKELTMTKVKPKPEEGTPGGIDIPE
jgi:serine/threonine protein kinase